jgi:hypothetical protein
LLVGLLLVVGLLEGRRVPPLVQLAADLGLFVLGVLGTPTAVAVAILRQRLYDIDRIINRTLVYGLLTAGLGLGYAGSVLVLGQLFGGVTNDPPSWAVAGVTLAWRPCSGRPAVASRRGWTGCSTGAATTRPGPSRRSAPASVSRSAWSA